MAIPRGRGLVVAILFVVALITLFLLLGGGTTNSETQKQGATSSIPLPPDTIVSIKKDLSSGNQLMTSTVSSSTAGSSNSNKNGNGGNEAYAERTFKFAAPSEQWYVPPEKPNGKKVIITGGAGFIGSQLGYHLHKEGYEVVLIDNMAFGYLDNVILDNGTKFGRFIIGDVLDYRVRKYIEGADALFHFAALSALPICQSEPQRAIEVNVAGTSAMLEAARLGNVRRFLFASTSAVYENNKESVLSEDLNVSPHLHYSLSKYQSELLVKAVSEVYDMDTVIFRFFNVFGPHQDFRRKSPPFTSYIVREIVNGRSPILHSNGLQSRDYIFLTDLLSLVTKGMTIPEARGETFNVASGKAYSVRDMYNITAKALGSTIQPVFHSPEKFWSAYPQMFEGSRPIKKEILIAEVNKNVLGSTEKARKILKWEPKTSMEEGLQQVVSFIQEKQRSGVNMKFDVAWN